MANQRWKYRTGGIPDELFIRGQVPMTKAEVRVVTLAKARLLDRQVIWDIGAGTGSISVEAALTAVNGSVFAVEREPAAVELIKKNAELFGALNLTVCPGTAPAALAGLPAPERVFIGGSGGNLAEIMAFVHGQLPTGGRVVVNAVVLETLGTALAVLRQLDYAHIDVTQVSIARAVEVGSVHMLKSHNPVFVVSGEKKQ